MKGYVRSTRYWLWMLEKVFFIMMVTVAVVVIVSAGSMREMQNMLRMYLPMCGGIFCIAIMLNAGASYIPQSMSMSATRKEVFFAMMLSVHTILAETVLLALLLDLFVMKGVFGAGYITASVFFYLMAAGLGSLLCAVSLKLGNRFALIVYVIVVVILACIGGVVGSLSAVGNELNFEQIWQIAGSFWYAAVIFDLIMMMLGYLAIRRYEVRA